MIARGQLSITYIDAPPRSGSSARFRALCEVVDAGAYEPFHVADDALEVGLARVLAAAREARARAPDRTPVRLVVKEIARYLPSAIWARWSALADHVITLVRDPLQQLSSLITRAANDLH